jgi:serine protease Do
MSLVDKVRRQKLLSFTVILFTLAVGVFIGTVSQTGAKAARQQSASDATPLVMPNPVEMQNSFSKIAKQLGPAVVNISTEYIPQRKETTNNNRKGPQTNRNRRAPQGDDDADNGMQEFMQRFFGGGGGGFSFGGPQEQDQPSAALGSGVVIDKAGYIMTNNHVVEKATRIKVKFNNDPIEYPATVIGTDPETDLAVIKVDKKNLTVAKIGNSDALQVGDWVVAIGSPFGFEATVTAGIVSALARDVPDSSRGSLNSFQHFIQTDAAINPGNSGGPLLNLNGEVIGINSMIASRSGGFQGIGFAMPSSTVVKVYNQIIKEGHVTRGSIGIRFSETPNNSDLLKVYGADHGIFVGSVEPDGPADKAGMKAQDIITSVNGHAINKSQDLIDTVADTPVGNSVKVNIIRDKKPETLTVVIGDRAKIFADNVGPVKSKAAPDSDDALDVKFGMSVQSLRPADRDQLGYKGKGSVMIASVEPGSFADDIGLAKGDVILELNRQAVDKPEDLRKLQSSLKSGDSVAFHVARQAGRGGDWQSLFVPGRMP